MTKHSNLMKPTSTLCPGRPHSQYTVTLVFWVQDLQ